MYDFHSKLTHVEWKSLKIKDVPIDVVRFVICFFIFILPCLCSQSV